MARTTRKASTAKKAPEFKLDVDTRFEFTGRSAVEWFNLYEEDKYGKVGGKVYPEDVDKIASVVDDLMAEAQAQCDDAGITVVQVDPAKKNDDGDVYYSISRKATKKDGSVVEFKYRNIRGKPMEEPEDDFGNGSILNIKYFASAYFMPESVTKVAGQDDIVVPARIGVSLSPLEVQVIDHKVYEGDEWEDESGDADGDEPWEDETPKASRKKKPAPEADDEDEDY